MTVPPLPESNCVRVRLDYADTADNSLGSRFFLGYSGGAPSIGNCNTLAADIAAAWASNCVAFVSDAYSLREVDVLDISVDAGNSGKATVDTPGTASGSVLSSNAATNVEFSIARRYRGGKPRMYWPPGTVPDTVDISHWSPTFVSNVNSDVAAFFAAISALSIGSMGTLQHVNVSYYFGFQNVTNSSGRMRAAPKYRVPNAKVDPITAYACKALIGSQRRRRASTTY